MKLFLPRRLSCRCATEAVLRAGPNALAALVALSGLAGPLMGAAHAQASDSGAPAPTAPQRNAGQLQLAPAPDATSALNQHLVQVQRVAVEGGTLLPTAELQALLQPWLGSQRFSDLRAAAAAVQQGYREAGYGAVMAFLPEQNLSDGLLRIVVVEGRLSGVQVVGNQRWASGQVLAALTGLKIGATPRLFQVDSQLQMLNDNPSRHVRVLLQPGAATGEVAARVDVQEAEPQRWTGRLDNTGTARTGRWRAALGWQHAQLFRRDQVLGIDLQTAPEKPSGVAILSANYRLPFYAQQLMLDAYAAYSDADGGRTGTAAGDLQLNGRGHILGLRLQRYLRRWGEVDQRLMMGIEQRDYLNTCSIDGLPDGACGAAGASVTLRPLSLTYLAQSSSGNARQWSLQAGLHHNLALGGRHADAQAFAAVRPGASPHYTVARVQGQATQALPRDWSVSARFSAQAADGPVVSGEQLGLGGAQGVRGFAERELLGDDGLQVSLELRSASFAPSDAWDLRWLAFADAGWVRNHQGLACLNQDSACNAAGLGLGLRAGKGAAQARLDVGHALTTGPATARHATRVHASLSLAF